MLKKLFFFVIFSIVVYAVAISGLFVLQKLDQKSTPPNNQNPISIQDTKCIPDKISTRLDASYGASNLDIYYPEGKGCQSLPVMIYVHGGGWQKGDKSQQVTDKVPYFISQGFVFVSVNYRLVPDIMYPVFNEDVAQAVAWVSQNISTYGGNPEKLSLIGHSSGGTIISSLAVDESYLQKVSVPRAHLRCAISLDAAGYDISDASSDQSGIFTNLFGGNNNIYKQAFGVNPQVLADASPMSHVEAGKYIPSFFIVTRGQTKRVNLATEFSNTLKEAGVYSELLVTQGLDHSGVNKVIGRADDALITPSLTVFLSRCR